jgi:4-amino-4-deoxy-L-arabinose transferase-like glycosyltransferase
LRVPSFAEPHHYGDEGIFAAVAQQVLNGQVLYDRTWDDKPPLVFWLYAAVLSLTGPSMPALRLVAALWAALAAGAAAALAGRLGGRRAAWIAGAGAAFLLSTPLIEANLALTELFASAPVAWAIVLLAADRHAEASPHPRGSGAGQGARRWLFD